MEDGMGREIRRGEWRGYNEFITWEIRPQTISVCWKNKLNITKTEWLIEINIKLWFGYKKYKFRIRWIRLNKTVSEK